MMDRPQVQTPTKTAKPLVRRTLLAAVPIRDPNLNPLPSDAAAGVPRGETDLARYDISQVSNGK
ncbi:MAG: hypothetical protein CMJ50_02180 [Planctomycetaceae bacterium]|nr:hypothetical protein [Planctomycetaceae bacterium]